MRSAIALLILLAHVLGPGGARATEPEEAPKTGTLRFRVLDGATGESTPARVSVVDEAGRSHVAPSAVPVAGECMQPAPAGWARAAEGGLPGAGLRDPGSGAKIFYVDAVVEMEVPIGRYRVSATKGFEWETRSVVIEVLPGRQGAAAPLQLSRWIDMPAAGWVSADGHLHIGRPSPALDPVVATWMAAEDLHVANLLQMGREGEVVGARQYAFGEAGRYRSGEVVLAPGQENPRTWLLGHGMVFGASRYIDPGERYLVYQPVWRQARAEGGLAGYAHWQPPGVLIDAPTGLVDFLEVLQFDTPNYEMLYRLWGLGLLVAPIAGTDFPCIGDLPGADRFYARVGRPFTWERWLDAVGEGRTFVTNGPLLEFEVNGAGIGDRIRIDVPGVVRVEASVRFDPTRDDVEALELVRDGKVVHRVTEVTELGRIAFSLRLPMEQSGWLALRSDGAKIDRRPIHDDMGGAIKLRPRSSAAHTGVISVRVAGTPPLGTGTAARRLAEAAREEMAALHELFESSKEHTVLSSPKWARGVSRETLRASRSELLGEIGLAEAWYGDRAGSVGLGDGSTDLAAFDESLDFRTSPRIPGGASRPRP
ncbi:MAG: CehA/McbA family metallohydrolase [Candidatus Binatia bacterium]|nr:CehA/McbA family metallohydrolase [Candidatus Binatia bacterium]